VSGVTCCDEENGRHEDEQLFLSGLSPDQPEGHRHHHQDTGCEEERG